MRPKPSFELNNWSNTLHAKDDIVRDTNCMNDVLWKDNILSKMWFEQADRIINIHHKQLFMCNKLYSKTEVDIVYCSLHTMLLKNTAVQWLDSETQMMLLWKRLPCEGRTKLIDKRRMCRWSDCWCWQRDSLPWQRSLLSRWKLVGCYVKTIQTHRHTDTIA